MFITIVRKLDFWQIDVIESCTSIYPLNGTERIDKEENDENYQSRMCPTQYTYADAR